MSCLISPHDVQLPCGVLLCISFILVSHSSFDGFWRQKDWLTSNRPVFLSLQKSENQDRLRTGLWLWSSPVLVISGPDRSGSGPGSVFFAVFQLNFQALLTLNICLPTGAKMSNKGWSGQDYKNTTNWLATRPPSKPNDTTLYAKSFRRLQSSQATSRCLVTWKPLRKTASNLLSRRNSSWR